MREVLASWSIPLAAIIIAAGSFVVTVRMSVTKADLEYAVQIDERVQELETKLAACEAERAAVERKNLQLMERLFQLDKQSRTEWKEISHDDPYAVFTGGRGNLRGAPVP